MKINITVLFQIINFWIAHAVLSRYLLKPFVLEFFKKQRLKKMIAAQLQQQEHDLQRLIAEKNQALVDFRVAMKVKYAVKPLPAAYEQVGELSHNVHLESAMCEEEAAAFLAKKVVDAYRN